MRSTAMSKLALEQGPGKKDPWIASWAEVMMAGLAGLRAGFPLWGCRD